MVRSGGATAGAINMAGLSALTGRWRERWPSTQQPSADACLSIVNARDILLQALSREAAKTASLPHEVHSMHLPCIFSTANCSTWSNKARLYMCLYGLHQDNHDSVVQ